MISPKEIDPALYADRNTCWMPPGALGAATCEACSYRTYWGTNENAMKAATWHAHDAHPLLWLQYVGERPPGCDKPDPADQILED